MIAFVLALGILTLIVLILGLASISLILMNWRHRRRTGTEDWTDRWQQAKKVLEGK